MPVRLFRGLPTPRAARAYAGDMRQDRSPTDQKQAEALSATALGVALGPSFGAGVGTTIGVLIDQVAFGISLGAGVGLLVGLLIGAVIDARREAAADDTDREA